VQARGVAEEAVAHQRQTVGQRQELGHPLQEHRQGGDREERPGEEPRQNRDRRHARDVLLLLRDATGKDLRHPVHADREQRCGSDGPGDSSERSIEVDAACEGDAYEDGELQTRDRDCDDKISHHEQRARDRCRQQLALSTLLPIDDHTEPGEHRVEGNQETRRADRDEGLVLRTRMQGGLERRRDHECEHDRRQQRDNQFSWRAHRQVKSPLGKRCERVEGSSA
jgi:hypothetical protein